MADCENQILREIAEPLFKRRDIAQTYALAMLAEVENGEVIDWRKVNLAIIARWSPSALEWIKTQAHNGKCFEPRKAVAK
jgi:hypothetical protein